MIARANASVVAVCAVALLLALLVPSEPARSFESATSTSTTSPLTGPPTATAAPSPLRNETLVLRIPFRDLAERDRLATEWGAAEVSTLRRYLTVWADQATYARMLARGLHVAIDEAATRRANRPIQFGTTHPDAVTPATFNGGYRTVEEMEAFLVATQLPSPPLAVRRA